MKKLYIFFLFLIPFTSIADDMGVVKQAEQVFEAAQIACSGISDEIGKVANISKVNTVVTAVGTVAAGGALYAGIKKSQEDKEIDELVEQICASGGCTAEGVEAMSDEQFFTNVLQPMAQIAELQKKIDKSKKLGNWRTGLLAGTIGTNLASAIMSGLNTKQSELVQHVSACNAVIKTVSDTSLELKRAGVNPNESIVVKQLDKVRTWCNQINTKDIEKIENRMKVVMGTSIAGTAVGVVGTVTSAAANSDKYTNMENRMNLSEKDKKKGQALNTTANIMAGANIATGAVETGFNISLITLTKKLMKSAQRCEDVLK